MSIRARIFFVFITAVIVGFTLLAIWIRNDVADRYGEAFEEVMVDSVNLLAELISDDLNKGDANLQQFGEAFERLKSRRFSAQVFELEKTHADIRVYVTDKQGRVIFDSNNGKAVGEDYSQWLDVSLTLQGEYGARTSPIEDQLTKSNADDPPTVAYVAAPIYQQAEIVGVVSLAKPKNNIDRYIANARNNLFNAVIYAVAIVLLLALMLYIWVTRPLQSLVGYANSVGRGERTTLPQLGNNEMGDVGAAIDNMRKALEDKQYVEDYVQSITHELKSPLTAIHAAAELLSQDIPSDKRQQFADTILKESNRLSEFASQLLQLAALEKGSGIDKSASVDLQALVEDVLQSHQLECQAKELKTSLDAATDCNACGDAFLLRQAIDNLVRNAIEFCPKGGVIHCRIQRHDKQLVLQVQDNGSGIPGFAFERIFERFYSLPRPDSGQKSSGLGLNFAREVAEQHGGTLTLENCNPGAKAELTLPIAH